MVQAKSRESRLASLLAALAAERSRPDRNACHARAIENEIEALLALPGPAMPELEAEE